MQISPSILSEDFANLQKEIETVNNADMIHIDVMDGIFVPNITIGIPVVQSLKNTTNIPLDVHLMITNPEKYIDKFIEAGADSITFHAEATENISKCIQIISESCAKPCIALKPNTNIEKVIPYLDNLYMVLIMTVEPGFGGQQLIPSCLDKVRALKEKILVNNNTTLIQADGGISEKNIGIVKESGVDVAVVGSALFTQCDRHKLIEKMKYI